MNLLAIIPARGGSKGVPRKNIRMVAGKPLIAWTLLAARSASCLNRIIVSTDNEEIAEISRAWGGEVIMRPPELAQDETPTLPVLRHVAEKIEEVDAWTADAVVTLQPTSPLRRAEHIEAAVSLFAADPEADSLVSCIEVPHIFHPFSVMRRDESGYMVPFLEGAQIPTRRQDKPAVFARNGAAIYITRRNCLNRFVFGGRLLSYMMSPKDSLDIDSEADLAQAEIALRERI